MSSFFLRLLRPWIPDLVDLSFDASYDDIMRDLLFGRDEVHTREFDSAFTCRSIATSDGDEAISGEFRPGDIDGQRVG